MYDTTARNSFDNVSKLLETLNQENQNDAIYMLIANKIDAVLDRVLFFFFSINETILF
jgi:GTPase SAR1 family protein